MPTSLRAPTLFQGSLLCSVTEGLDEGASVCPGLCPPSLSIVSAPPSSLKKPFLPWPSLGRISSFQLHRSLSYWEAWVCWQQLHCCLRNPLVPFLQSNLRESWGRKNPTGAQSKVHTDLRAFLFFPFSPLPHLLGQKTL